MHKEFEKMYLHKDNLLNSTWISNYASHFHLITTGQYLISVTTKEEFSINPDRKGKTPQPPSTSE